MNQTMKAAVAHAYGEPLRIEDVKEQRLQPGHRHGSTARHGFPGGLASE